MLTEYIRAAMRRATYDVFPADQTYFGRIPSFQGLWANEDSLEGCRDALQAALEDWMLFRLSQGLELPIIDGLDPNFKQRASA